MVGPGRGLICGCQMFRVERPSIAIRQRLLIYAALPLAYVITGRLGVLLAVPPGYATAVFMPAGIAVGAMFVAGAFALPGIFVGRFCSMFGLATRSRVNLNLSVLRQHLSSP